MNELIEKYQEELAGTSLYTLNPSGWSFEDFLKEVSVENEVEYHHCLFHYTAQYDFALDGNLAVYVWDLRWIKLYESVFNLVALETVFRDKLPTAEAKHIKVRSIGEYQSLEEFEDVNSKLLRDFTAIKIKAESMNAIYYNDSEVIRIGRFYDSEKFVLRAAGYASRSRIAC